MSQACPGGQSVGEPSPVIQDGGFTTLGPVVDGVERERRIGQHPPLQVDIAVPCPLVGRLLSISFQARIPERLFSLDSAIEENFSLFDVRLIAVPIHW